MKSDIVVFLPTYNEIENLPIIVEKLFSLDLDLSILIVDDQSPDGTGDAADRLVEKYPDKIQVIHREGPRGRGKAGIVGLREASKLDCRLVVEMDADLSHDPNEMQILLDGINEADMVIGSRYIEGGSAASFGLFRSLNSKTARFLSIVFLGLNYTDPTSGYRVYKKEVLTPLPWDRMVSDGPSIVEETLYYIKRNGAKILEVPIHYKERHSGSTKITPGIIIRWIINLMRIRITAIRA
jgi:dolichol-phosphate mannosyltransferase